MSLLDDTNNHIHQNTSLPNTSFPVHHNHITARGNSSHCLTTNTTLQRIENNENINKNMDNPSQHNYIPFNYKRNTETQENTLSGFSNPNYCLNSKISEENKHHSTTFSMKPSPLTPNQPVSSAYQSSIPCYQKPLSTDTVIEKQPLYNSRTRSDANFILKTPITYPTNVQYNAGLPYAVFPTKNFQKLPVQQYSAYTAGDNINTRPEIFQGTPQQYTIMSQAYSSQSTTDPSAANPSIDILKQLETTETLYRPLLPHFYWPTSFQAVTVPTDQQYFTQAMPNTVTQHAPEHQCTIPYKSENVIYSCINQPTALNTPQSIYSTYCNPMNNSLTVVQNPSTPEIIYYTAPPMYYPQITQLEADDTSKEQWVIKPRKRIAPKKMFGACIPSLDTCSQPNTMFRKVDRFVKENIMPQSPTTNKKTIESRKYMYDPFSNDDFSKNEFVDNYDSYRCQDGN